MKYMFSSITSIFFGLILRMALDYKKEELSVKSGILQTIFSLSLSYFAYILWRDNKWAWNLDLVLGSTSFFASFIISLFDRLGKVGLKAFFLNILKRYLAESELDKTE